MPLLAAFLSTMFTAIGGFMLRIFLVRTSLRAVGVAGVLSLWAALLAAFNGFISPLLAQAFSTQYGQFIGLAFPPVAGSCITTIVGAAGAVQAYRLKRRFVEQTTGV